MKAINSLLVHIPVWKIHRRWLLNLRRRHWPELGLEWPGGGGSGAGPSPTESQEPRRAEPSRAEPAQRSTITGNNGAAECVMPGRFYRSVRRGAALGTGRVVGCDTAPRC